MQYLCPLPGVSPGFSTQSDFAVEELVETGKARFNVGFDFVTILSSLFLFLHLLRHLFGAAGQAEIQRAAKKAEMADVKQMKKSVPLITCESASWCSVSTYLIWIFASRLIQSSNQSRATLWVLDTCLIVGHLPLTIILISASLSWNTYNTALSVLRSLLWQIQEFNLWHSHIPINHYLWHTNQQSRPRVLSYYSMQLYSPQAHAWNILISSK